MAEEIKGQTSEGVSVAEAKPKTSSRPSAVEMNTSFRFALQRDEQRLDETSDVKKIGETQGSKE